METHTEMKPSEAPSEKVINMSGRNILHFSDGTLDMDELNAPKVVEQPDPIDPKKLTWMPWMWYYTTFTGSKVLEVCDYMGEFLADFFGITTPKYQYEISEYHRMKREEELNRQKDLERNSTWTDIQPERDYIVTDQGKSAAEKYELKTCSVSTDGQC